MAIIAIFVALTVAVFWDEIVSVLEGIYDFIEDVIKEVTDVLQDIATWLREVLGPALAILEIVCFLTGQYWAVAALAAIHSFAGRVEDFTKDIAGSLVREIGYLYKTIGKAEEGLYRFAAGAIQAIYKDMTTLHEQVIEWVSQRSEAFADRLREETEGIMLVVDRQSEAFTGRLKEETEGIMLVMDREVDRVDHEVHVVAYKVEDVGHFGGMLAKTLEV